MSEERNWQEEFEDIVDDPKQNPIQVFGEEAVEDLGPAIAEGQSLREVLKSYEEYKRLERMDDE